MLSGALRPVHTCSLIDSSPEQFSAFKLSNQGVPDVSLDDFHRFLASSWFLIDSRRWLRNSRNLPGVEIIFNSDDVKDT